MKFYRTVFTYEVLSNELLEHRPYNLSEVHYEVTEGHSSGMFLESSTEEVSAEKMAALLVKQGSDPAFLNEEEE